MKTRFNITLLAPDNVFISKLIILAAYQNSKPQQEKMSLQQMKQYYLTDLQLNYGSQFKATVITIVNHTLLVDIKEFDKTVCICEIQEVEISELAGMEASVEKFIQDINNPDDITGNL